jgi:3-deoxy-D-manno-octulosonic-acid transferase
MLRIIYSGFFYLLLPFILLRLLIKSRNSQGYRKRWRERFGWFSGPTSKGGIWIHAVSVGETIAAVPLIKALQKQYPDTPFIITTMTPTGSERVKALFDNTVFHVYVPYDFPGAVKRFLRKTQPKLLILMETELWPNCLHYCAKQEVPILLANARLSERSYRGYSRIGGYVAKMMQQITFIAAQARPDANRFIALGAESNKVVVTGSMKFDLAIPADMVEQASALRHMLGLNRLIWIAASTHEGEEEQVLQAFRKIRQRALDSLLLLVPRHPERFNKVAALCEKEGYTVNRRSQHQPCAANTDVYLGDTMGELLLLFAVSDVAYMGGSLVPVGGHNMLEPAALGIPSVIGPYYFNFQTIVDLMQVAGGLKVIANSDELAENVIMWLNDPIARQQAGDNAKHMVDAHRGAVAAHVALIQQIVV